MKTAAVIIVSIFLCITKQDSFAQNHRHECETWFGYISSVKVSEHWAIWNDFHFVPNSFFVNRHGLTYVSSKHLDITAGYANILTTAPFSQSLIRHEHRPWGQVVGRIGLNKHFSLRSRFRYDARFRKGIEEQSIIDNYIFYHRLRLFNNIRYSLMPNGKPTWHFDILHEFLYNIGKQVDNGTDQHRVFLLAGRHIKGLNIMVGYHLRAIPQANGYLLRHGFTIWMVHNLSRKCINDGCAAD